MYILYALLLCLLPNLSSTQGFGINLIKVPDDDRSQVVCSMALLRKYFISGDALSGSVLYMSLTSASMHTQKCLLDAIHGMVDFPWSIVIRDAKNIKSAGERNAAVLHEKPQCYFVVIENLEDEDLEDIFEDWKTTLNWNPLAQFVVYLSSVEETDEEMTELMIEILLSFMNKKIYNVNVIGQNEENGYYYGKTVFPYHPDNNCGNRVISIETLDVCDYQEEENLPDDEEDSNENDEGYQEDNTEDGNENKGNDDEMEDEAGNKNNSENDHEMKGEADNKNNSENDDEMEGEVDNQNNSEDDDKIQDEADNKNNNDNEVDFNNAGDSEDERENSEENDLNKNNDESPETREKGADEMGIDADKEIKAGDGHNKVESNDDIDGTEDTKDNKSVDHNTVDLEGDNNSKEVDDNHGSNHNTTEEKDSEENGERKMQDENDNATNERDEQKNKESEVENEQNTNNNDNTNTIFEKDHNIINNEDGKEKSDGEIEIEENDYDESENEEREVMDQEGNDGDIANGSDERNYNTNDDEQIEEDHVEEEEHGNRFLENNNNENDHENEEGENNNLRNAKREIKKTNDQYKLHDNSYNYVTVSNRRKSINHIKKQSSNRSGKSFEYLNSKFSKKQRIRSKKKAKRKFSRVRYKRQTLETDQHNSTEDIEQKSNIYLEEIYRALFYDKFPKDLSGCPLVAAYRPWEPYIFTETTENDLQDDDDDDFGANGNVMSNNDNSSDNTNSTEENTIGLDKADDEEETTDDAFVDTAYDTVSSESEMPGDTEGKAKLSGIEYQLLQTIGERLHISIDLQVENRNLYHLFQQLIDGDIEMIVGGIDEDPSISQFVSTTVPYHQDDLTWCVAKAQRSYNLFNFLASFSPLTWLLTFVFAFIATSSIAMMQKLLKLRSNHLRGYFGILFRVIGIVFSQSVPLVRFPTPIRLTFATAFFMGLMFINAYQSFLISTLTTPKSAYQISRVEEIYEQRMKIMGSVENVRHLSKPGEVFKYIREKFQMCYNIEECLLQAAHNEHLAVAVSRQHSFYNPRIPRNELYCFDRNENLYVYLVTMLLPKKFHLLHKINPVIQHVIESGHMQKWARDLDMRRQILEERSRVHEEAFRSLTLGQVVGSFVFTGVMLAFAFSILILECWVHRLATRRRRRTRLKIVKYLHRKFQQA